MKNNKAPDDDNITAEMLKNTGEEMKEELYKMIIKIWKEERMPESWKTGILCPIHTTFDRPVKVFLRSGQTCLYQQEYLVLGF